MLPLTFLIAWHLEISEWPIILSGEQILMKGNCESSEILAARAVFPLWGGPEAKHMACQDWKIVYIGLEHRDYPT